jgi:enterobactin synthetase component D
MNMFESKHFKQITSLNIRFHSKGEETNWDDFLTVRDTYMKMVEGWHEKRQLEFLQGRHLAHMTLRELNVKEWNQVIDIGESREALYPAGVSGALTHNKDWVVFAFVPGNLSVGLDIEERGRVKKELKKQILTSEDELLIKSLERNCSDRDLMTLIFSAKEACYKGLFPFVEEYFGLLDAYAESIDLDNRKFVLRITKRFRKYPDAKNVMVEGHFLFDDDNVLTYLSPRNEAEIFNIEKKESPSE